MGVDFVPAAIVNRTALNFRLDCTAHAKAKIIARREDRYLNAQLENWVKKAIEQYENEHGEIALADE